MRFCFLFISVLSTTVWAQSLKVKIIDGTHGKEGTADVVRVMLLSGGMAEIGSVENAKGTVDVPYTTNGPGDFLVQATKGKVTYSARVKDPSAVTDITVYDSLQDASKIDVRTSSIAIYAYEKSIDIGFFINLDNIGSPPSAFSPDGATYTFELPNGFKNLDASTTYANGMPLRQNLVVDGNKAELHYPLKPGRTLLMVRTLFDYNPETENQFRIPLPEGQNFAHILVLPPNLKVTGEGVSFVSLDKKHNANLFQFEGTNNEINLVFSGVPDVLPDEEPKKEQPQRQREIKNSKNDVDQFRIYILIGSLGLLCIVSLIGVLRPRS